MSDNYLNKHKFKGGGMVEIFLENSILSYELGWMGRASTNILKVVWGPRAHHGPGGHQ